MLSLPKIKTVEVISPFEFRITFDNGIIQTYNCGELLSRPQFQLLKTYAFFKGARVDPGGYRISWNDDMDLATSELWINGSEVFDKTEHGGF